MLGWARTQLTEEGGPPPETDDFTWAGMNETARTLYVEREWRGADAFDTACKSGNARACAELGRCVGWGVGRKHSPEDARTLFELSCAMGAPEGCNWAGDASMRLGGDTVGWFEKACDMGLEDGCRNLSIRDGSTEEERETIYLRGCETDARSCHFLGQHYLDLDQQDLAVEYFALACEAGISGSCQ